MISFARSAAPGSSTTDARRKQGTEYPTMIDSARTDSCLFSVPHQPSWHRHSKILYSCCESAMPMRWRREKREYNRMGVPWRARAVPALAPNADADAMFSPCCALTLTGVGASGYYSIRHCSHGCHAGHAESWLGWALPGLDCLTCSIPCDGSSSGSSPTYSSSL